MVAQLIQWADQQGYELTGGELYRPPQTARYYKSIGIGILNSKHCQRLAIDLNLFIDGEYQRSTEVYKPLGEYWESLGGRWGGRFKRKDGNHFEL